MTPVPKGAEDDRALQANALLDKKVLPSDGLLGEGLTVQLFALYDIPEPRLMLARCAEDLPRLLEAVGTPAVLKISSPDITEKSEIDGVRKHVKNEKEASNAYEEILKEAEKHSPTAAIRGVVVQKEVPHDQEFVLSATRDGEKVSLTGDRNEKSLAQLPARIKSLMKDVPAISKLTVDLVAEKGSPIVIDAKVMIDRGSFIDAD